LQTERVRSIFLVGNMPHRLKPHLQRLAGLMEDSPRGYRSLLSTLLAKKQSTRHFPSVASAALRTFKPIRPSEGDQVGGASFFCSKTVSEFRQSTRVVFHDHTLQVVCS
jgi:hypothetical protein